MLETKRLTDTLPPSARIHVARRRVRTWAAFSLLALCLPLSSVAAADVVCVPNDGIDASCTIGKGAATISAGVALANAAGGDTVLVNPGSYVENVGIDRDVALVSKSGRAVTTITGISSAGALGTLQVTGGTTAVQIGAPGQGFTVVGIDNGAPGIENAAIYFQGSHSGAQIIDNEIVAAGDAGLLTEYGATISGFSITDNVFSGSTYVGSPSGYGFGMQFTLPNVPRQLVVMGCGSGCTSTSSVTFSDNQIVGSSGGINPDLTGTECPIVGQTCEQGNTLVTIDADGAVITGNGFLGSTGSRAHDDHHPLGIFGPNIVEQVVLTPRHLGELIHRLLDDGRGRQVVGIRRFTSLEEDIGILSRPAKYGLVGVHGPLSVRANKLLINHCSDVIGIQMFDFVDLMRSAETIKEV